MIEPKNVVGEKYNRFTIVEHVGYKISGGKRQKMVRALCECGNERVAEYREIKRGKRKSCGCINEERKRKINAGDKFGFWEVIKETDKYKHTDGSSERRFECKCVCQKEKSVNIQSLLNGSSKSCGCQGRVKEKLPEIKPISLEELNKQDLGEWKAIDIIQYYKTNKKLVEKIVIQCSCGTKEEKVYKEGLIKVGNKMCTPCFKYKKSYINNLPHKKRLHNIWGNMKTRCRKPKSKDFIRYGAKGVNICDEWCKFINFYNWALENGYTEELTIDRKDSNGNYCPENCEWVTKTYNSRKTSHCKLNWENVNYIRNHSHIELKTLANRFGVGECTIKSIINFKTWIPET